MTKITDWLTELDRISKEVEEKFAEMTDSEINWKQNPSSWSIGQHLEHLIIINSSYFPVINSIKEGEYKLPWHGKIGGIVSFIGKSILNSVEPETVKKSKTLPVWEPSGSEISVDILELFSNHQKELKLFISETKELVDRRVVVPSPANSLILYHIDTAYDIIVAHEKRHVQAAQKQLVFLRI